MGKTPEQMVKEVDKIVRTCGGDIEAMHSETDELMENLLIDLGYVDMVKRIRDTERWYA